MARKTHSFGITLRSEKAKTETFEDLQRALDVAVLNDAGVYIMAWDWTPSKNGKGKSGGNGNGNIFSSIAAKSPVLVEFFKKYSWKQLYIGFTASTVLLVLIYKLIIRYLFS